MTTKQFWMKLDQLAQRKDKASVPEEAALILIDAFVDGLDILIACSYDGESTSQLYSYRTSPDIDRELLCYTRKGIALADPNLEGSLTWRSHPVRQVMLNAVTRKEYIGLLFNHNNPALSFSVPKELFEDRIHEMVSSLAEKGDERFAKMDIPFYGPLEGV